MWVVWHQHVSKVGQAPSLTSNFKSPAQAVQKVRETGGTPVLLLEVFATPPQSAREVAERYGKVFSAVEQQWQAALAAAKTNNQPPPTAL